VCVLQQLGMQQKKQHSMITAPCRPADLLVDQYDCVFAVAGWQLQVRL
jgi:hypothetical protein